jgi:cytochrome c2
VGTFGLDGLQPADLPASDYGKILVLDRATWRSEVFTTGHRNPEGLLVEGGGIWSTEHGPHGGDELNLVVRGSDYGWPSVSYGTDYGHKSLALGAVPGDHEGFAQPVYSWTPSIGVSSFIRVDGELFPLWRGDFLVGALSGLGNGEAIFRVRLREGRVVTAERIPVGVRVRDLVQLPGGGPVVLWDGAGTIRLLRPADHVFGACSGCHGIRNAQHAIGPDLYGVVGSPVARHADYGYSAAMLEHGGRWTPERLDRFLANPRGEVPGTSMDHEGIASAAVRADVIRFLSEISAGRPMR